MKIKLSVVSVILLCVSANCLNGMGDWPVFVPGEDAVLRLTQAAFILNTENLAPNRAVIRDLMDRGLINSSNIDSPRQNSRGESVSALSVAIRSAYGIRVRPDLLGADIGDTMDTSIITMLIGGDADPLKCAMRTQINHPEPFLLSLQLRRQHLMTNEEHEYNEMIRILHDVRARHRVLVKARQSTDLVHVIFSHIPNESLVEIVDQATGVSEVNDCIKRITGK